VRKIFYVPAGESIDDYKPQWDGVYAEIQHGLSENTKEYIVDESVAQEILIPEYKDLDCPVNFSDREYVQIYYWDDFESIKDEKPQIILEIWSNDLNNPSAEQNLIDKHIMNWSTKGNFWESPHIKLDIGWYEMSVKVDGIESLTRETSVYEYYLEEE
jgi:hypothetical protein